MAEENNERIVELETEIAALKKALAAQSEVLESRSVVDFAKIKKAIDDGTKSMVEAVKPVVQKCSEPGKVAAEKVGAKVSENPIISVIAAFGVGIVIGKLLELSLSCREK